MNILRPSSLDALRQCPQFRPGPPRDFTDAGTDRHAVARMILGNEIGAGEAMEKLPEDHQAGVQWFVDLVRLRAPMNDHPIQVERKLSITLPNFETITGTADVVCGPFIADLKWRWRDYSGQMAAYALGVLQLGYPQVTVLTCFAESRKHVVAQHTIESAEAIIAPILDRFDDATGAPSPCTYCGWCDQILTCPAHVARADAIRLGREDWQLDQYHGSKIDSADEAGRALRLARAISKWCEAVEHHCANLHKQGLTPSGFEERTRQGNRFIASVIDAFARAGLPQDVFLATCESKFTALVEAHRSINGTTKAASERIVSEKLGDVLQRRAPSTQLVETKTN